MGDIIAAHIREPAPAPSSRAPEIAPRRRCAGAALPGQGAGGALPDDARARRGDRSDPAVHHVARGADAVGLRVPGRRADAAAAVRIAAGHAAPPPRAAPHRRRAASRRGMSMPGMSGRPGRRRRRSAAATVRSVRNRCRGCRRRGRARWCWVLAAVVLRRRCGCGDRGGDDAHRRPAAAAGHDTGSAVLAAVPDADRSPRRRSPPRPWSRRRPTRRRPTPARPMRRCCRHPPTRRPRRMRPGAVHRPHPPATPHAGSGSATPPGCDRSNRHRLRRDSRCSLARPVHRRGESREPSGGMTFDVR